MVISGGDLSCEIGNSWVLLLSGATLVVMLLCFETMVLRRKASRTGYVVLLAFCLFWACFAAWQKQYFMHGEQTKTLQAVHSEKATLAAQIDELSKLVRQQDNVMKEKTSAMASLKAQSQTVQQWDGAC